MRTSGDLSLEWSIDRKSNMEHVPSITTSHVKISNHASQNSPFELNDSRIPSTPDRIATGIDYGTPHYLTGEAGSDIIVNDLDVYMGYETDNA